MTQRPAVAAEDTPLLATQSQQRVPQHHKNGSGNDMNKSHHYNDDEDPAIAALGYDPYDGDSGERLYRTAVGHDGMMIGRKWLISIAIYAGIVTILLLLQQRHLHLAADPLPEDDEPSSTMAAIQPGSMSRAVVPPVDTVGPLMSRLADLNRARLKSHDVVDDVVGSFMVMTDIHLEAWYDATNHDSIHNICRDRSVAPEGGLTCPQPSWKGGPAAGRISGQYPLGRINCDPPSSLLSMSFEAMRGHADRAYDQLQSASWHGQQHKWSPSATSAAPLDFILLTGDFVGHFTPCLSAVTEIQTHVAQLLSSWFPSRVLLPMIGNTDLFPDFTLSPLPDFVSTMAPSRPRAPIPGSLEFPWSPQRRLLTTPADNDAATNTDNHHPSRHEHHHHDKTAASSSSSTGTAKPIPASTMPSVFETPLNECTPQLARLANLWASFGWLNRSSTEFFTFCHGGYYSRHVTANLRVIVLNTVVWSPLLRASSVDKSSGDESTNRDHIGSLACDSSLRLIDPWGQLAWLRRELMDAEEKGQKVYLAGHIPPGDKRGVASLCPRYQKPLLDLLIEFNYVRYVPHASTTSRRHPQPLPLIIGSFWGDHSFDELRMVWDRDSAVLPVYINPGLTPRKRSNPAYRQYWYNRRTSEVLDYAQYYLPLVAANRQHQQHKPSSSLDSWQVEYTFRDAYHVDDMRTHTLQRLISRMAHDPLLLQAYQQRTYVSVASEWDTVSTLCDMRYLDSSENEQCRRTGNIHIVDRVINPGRGRR